MCNFCENPDNFSTPYELLYLNLNDHEIMRQKKWHERYLSLAANIAEWSKDTTKIGAIIVGKNGQILSTGYNGFPRKHFDYPKLYENREEKYKRIIHAEMNAIFNASLSGISLEGSTIYISGLPPCSQCTLGIVQVGISCVVVKQSDIDANVRWIESWELAKNFLHDARIELIII